MATDERRILILAGRLGRLASGWPLGAWLDRLEARGWRPQVVCPSLGTALEHDPRCIEWPALGRRWLGGWFDRSLCSWESLDRPDLLHAIHDEVSETALALAETAEVPYVQTVADFRTLARGLRLSRRWCRQLVAIRPDLKAGLVHGLGVPEACVSVIPPGVVPVGRPARVLASERVPVIGTGGPLDEASGLMVFLEAAHRVLEAGRDAEFVIAGQGAPQREMRRRAQQLRIGERVTVAEFPSVGADYWPVLDIYCQPSIGPNAGVALLQAMAHGVACIATDAPGLRGLIEPGLSGFVVPADDPESLGQAILDLLDHPDRAELLGRGALHRIRSGFDPDHEADALVELYERLLAEMPATGGSPV